MDRAVADCANGIADWGWAVGTLVATMEVPALAAESSFGIRTSLIESGKFRIYMAI